MPPRPADWWRSTATVRCFCGDAIADPIAGLVAAVAALRALHHGTSALVDVALAGVAASFAGPPLAIPPDVGATPPAPPPLAPAAPSLGDHTTEVINELSDQSAGHRSAGGLGVRKRSAANAGHLA